MRQLIQDPKSGKIEVAELPPPALRPGTLLVRNVRSAVSPGTERAMVSTGRDSYLKTARNRPDLVRRVLDTVKREGVLAAYRKVQAKLSEPKALGYASAGVVVGVGPGSGDHFRVGDRVACCGQGIASHAETVCVPVNLAARVPDGVTLDDACFATLGAIALHGVRQAEPRLGDRVAVVGLGILGLFTVQLLRAHGARVIAFDLAADQVDRAKAMGAEAGIAGGGDDQVAAAMAWSEGMGVDAVIVTAASPDDGPMVAAAGMCRDRGRVVAVGLVPFGLPRDIAYVKELELRISRSYGPGRYDAGFEEKGLDYPASYVRWTQTRNLETFLHLVADGRLHVAPLVTHRFALERAPEAYESLFDRGAKPLGMVIEYPEAAAAVPSSPSVPAGRKAGPVAGDVGVAFVGAGGFARAVLLPALTGVGGVKLEHVVTAHGLTAVDAQRKFGFRHAGTDAAAAFADPAVHLVCIATRHDAHADLVIRALEAGKHVFVEKPLALSEEQLVAIEKAATDSGAVLLVGFNRRFSPLARAARAAIEGRGPALMSYRVNAGTLPPGHWTLDPEFGGGRIVGEGCHFVDLLSFLAGDAPITGLAASCAGRPEGLSEDVVLQLGFGDGSVGQILYTAKGAPGLGKERLEVHAGGASLVVEDYRKGTLWKGAKSTSLGEAGKGHAQEIAALIEAVRKGGPSPIALATLVGVTRATLRAHEAIRGA